MLGLCSSLCNLRESGLVPDPLTSLTIDNVIHRNLVTYHKAALMASQNFWRLLTKDRVSLVVLSNAFRRIESMEEMADNTYKFVLAR